MVLNELISIVYLDRIYRKPLSAYQKAYFNVKKQLQFERAQMFGGSHYVDIILEGGLLNYLMIIQKSRKLH